MQRRWTLVTGASGFVGSRLVRRLVERGDKVRAFVRDGASLRQVAGLPADRFQLAFGDILVGSTVYRALAGCDRLYHVASAFRWWAPRPEEIIGPAVDGTRAVLEAARRRRLERVVVTSSVAALGNTETPVAMSESHPFDVKEPELYALSKRRALDVALEMADRGLPVVVVQPSAIAGPGDWKPTPVGQSILRYLNAKRATPIVPGGVSLADVDDVVAGHIAAMAKGTLGQCYILGGENITIETLLTHLSDLTRLPAPRGRLPPTLLALAGLWLETHARLTGSEPQLTRRLARSHLGRFAWVTSAKAETELGYTSRPALDTLRRSVQWFVSQGYVRESVACRLPRQLHSLEAS
jgi:dihydroflavonol-4-reductase